MQNETVTSYFQVNSSSPGYDRLCQLRIFGLHERHGVCRVRIIDTIRLAND